MTENDGQLLFLDRARLEATLDLVTAVDALEAGFRVDPLPEAPTRSHHEAESGELLIMPAWGQAGIGVKLVTIDSANPGRGLPLIHGIYVLFAGRDKRPVAAIDGGALTTLRTAAVSALATRHLAPPELEHLCIFGAGRQAHAHLDAMVAVRDIELLTVVARNPDRARGLVDRASRLGLAARVGSPEDVATAQLVCCCTSSRTPVLNGSHLSRGTHVNAIGAYRPDMRELDGAAIRRSRIVVEDRDAARAEAGDLILAVKEGEFSWPEIAADLPEVVRGSKVRRDAGDLTVFKSVGMAPQDLMVARAAVSAVLAEPPSTSSA